MNLLKFISERIEYNGIYKDIIEFLSEFNGKEFNKRIVDKLNTNFVNYRFYMIGRHLKLRPINDYTDVNETTFWNVTDPGMNKVCTSLIIKNNPYKFNDLDDRNKTRLELISNEDRIKILEDFINKTIDAKINYLKLSSILAENTELVNSDLNDIMRDFIALKCRCGQDVTSDAKR